MCLCALMVHPESLPGQATKWGAHPARKVCLHNLWDGLPKYFCFCSLLKMNRTPPKNIYEKSQNKMKIKQQLEPRNSEGCPFKWGTAYQRKQGLRSPGIPLSGSPCEACIASWKPSVAREPLMGKQTRKETQLVSLSFAPKEKRKQTKTRAHTHKGQYSRNQSHMTKLAINQASAGTHSCAQPKASPRLLKKLCTPAGQAKKQSLPQK